MIRSPMICNPPITNAEKRFSYVQYYIGGKDKERRKHSYGRNHWSGAKSLEWYSGHLVHDTLHGEGDYRWRYYGPEGIFATYEGHFFNNQLHGYGTMSYSDGRVFNGLFYDNVRWGPGIESHACMKEDVGIWIGTKLIRLCWRPDGASLAPDLMSSNLGKELVKPHRNILSSSVRTMGEVNSALELLKSNGAHPLTANNKWHKLYPTHCTDMSSALCRTEIFEHEYYMGKICSLESIEKPENAKSNGSDNTEFNMFYAWNNNDIMKHMMNHCYKHEIQRRKNDLDIGIILSGPRHHFKTAGQHEIDSRTLLMASYLGNISQVTQLVNENKIYPDVADKKGNTALMYATCGEQADVIHYLVESGADINSYNDSCCTPLGIALIKLACAQLDIPANCMLQALIPPGPIPTPAISAEQQFSEWNISRESQQRIVSGTLPKSPSKINRNVSSKRIKSLISLKDQLEAKKKSEASAPQKLTERVSEESYSEDMKLYYNVSQEYSIRVNEIFQTPIVNSPLYIFEVCDMIKEVDANEEEHKKLPDKNPKKVISKVLKEATKPSKDAMWQSDKDENKSIDSVEKQKRDMLARIMTIISQLLSDGANPKLVKCPQPALRIAIVSGSSEVVRHLICYGADVNEIYPEILGYTSLDIAISRPFTYDNLEIIKAILEHGADTQHRLIYDTTDDVTSEVLGPTLLHVVLARKTDNEIEEDIRRQIIELLLDYNCNPATLFKGRSPIDISIMKSMDIFDIFIKNPKTDLNSSINEFNQSVLVKMFYLPFFKSFAGLYQINDRLQKITDLLLYGANPLIECQNGEEKYDNIFVFAKKTLNDLEGNQSKATTPSGIGKQESKNKKMEKPKKDDKISTKSMGKMTDDLSEYKQTLELVTECARLLHIRWLQSKLVKETIDVIKKYSHRHWSMILKEIKFKKNIGLWLTAQSSLEIWNILTINVHKKKSLNNHVILKHLLNIVQFCANRITNGMSLKNPITAIEKGNIETEINLVLHDYKDSNSLDSKVLWTRCYAKPELIKTNVKIFNVCFECFLPLQEDKIICNSCKLISFCSFDCMKSNIPRLNCHPCSHILKDKYFPNNNNSNVQDFSI